MPLFNSQFLTRLRLVALAARRVDGGLAAPSVSHLPAGGTEVTGYRDYAAGDDVRQVDWNVCARHDELMVKQYRGEADHHFYVLLDASASMRAGTPAKFDVARWSAAALCYVALTGLARASIVVFSDRVVTQSGSVRGRWRAPGLLRFLEELSAREESTDLARAAEAFVARPQRRGPAVVVSDFYDPRGFQAGMDVLRRGGYQARMVQIQHPDEAAPDVLGDAELVDAESPGKWQLTVTERLVERYLRLFDAHQRGVRRYAAKYSLPFARIDCNLGMDQVLLKAVGITR
jgi:uncharacterized protein (DUF58 family)